MSDNTKAFLGMIPGEVSDKIAEVELSQTEKDGMHRVYIDYFEEDPDASGVKYKGQW